MDLKLRKIIEGIDNTFGEEFFNRIVLNLSSVMDVEYLFIAKLNMDSKTFSTIAFAADGKIADNFEYKLRNTPCEHIAEGEICSYRESVIDTFPKDQLLIDMEIEGYIGLPLRDSKNNTIGLMVALSKKTIEDEETIITLFKIFTGRISAEIERIEQAVLLDIKVKEKTQKLLKANKELKEQEKKLQELNDELESKVDAKLKELLEKEKLLLEQSKLAQMGEMLNMIAHQWRQPLNAMSASAINLSMKNDLDLLNKETIEETSSFIQQQTQNMSKIINDFMSFNKPGSDEEFVIFDALSDVSKMMLPQLTNRSISLNIDVDKELKVFHNKKSLEHVILNLINNSRDAFENKKDITNKEIKIYTASDDKSISLFIEDNAGGIAKGIIDKIFNPYFTTKEQGKGTGIGLYMSKQLVEDVGDTSIDVSVENGSTVFEIRFKI